MPPSRTPKTTPSKAGGSLAAFGFVPVAKEEALTRAANHIPTAPVVPVKVVPVKVSKGLKSATIRSVHGWEEEFQAQIGSSTNKIVFSSFVLTPEHIDALITYSTTCKTLKHFEFLYTDVSYDAKNDAKALTDACILKLARAYPTLQTVKLPGTSDLTDAAVLALCEHCPDLATLEITKAVAGSNAIGVGAFEGMLLNGDWAPGLKNITVCDVTWGTTKFMAKMREMSRSRPLLVVHLASISEEKKWGDWDIVRRINDSYQNGRKMNPYARMGRGGGGGGGGGGGWRGGGGGGWRGGWRGRGRGGWRGRGRGGWRRGFRPY